MDQQHDKSIEHELANLLRAQTLIALRELADKPVLTELVACHRTLHSIDEKLGLLVAGVERIAGALEEGRGEAGSYTMVLGAVRPESR